MGCGGSKVADSERDAALVMSALGYAFDVKALTSKEQKVSVMTGHWEIQRERIDSGNVVSLGEGAFGPVYEVKAKGIGLNDAEVAKLGSAVETQLAVVRQLSPTEDRELTVQFLRELQHMKELDHPNVMTLYAAVTVEEPRLMLVEHFHHGTLKAFLKAHRDTLAGSPTIRFTLGKCVASGVAYLAQNDVIHMDIAARNCMVTDRLVVKLADYAISRSVYASDYVPVQGYANDMPLRWMAPELLRASGKKSAAKPPDQPFSKQSDVWALGVTLWEIFTDGNTPYPSKSNDDVYEGIKANAEGFMLQVPESKRGDIDVVIRSCLLYGAGERENAATVRDRLADLLAQHGGFSSKVASMVRKGEKPPAAMEYLDPTFSQAVSSALDAQVQDILNRVGTDDDNDDDDGDDASDGEETLEVASTSALGNVSQAAKDLTMDASDGMSKKESKKSKKKKEKEGSKKKKKEASKKKKKKEKKSSADETGLKYYDNHDQHFVVEDTESEGEIEIPESSPFASAKKVDAPVPKPRPVSSITSATFADEEAVEEEDFSLTNVTSVVEIPRKKITMGVFLGKGAFGEVRKGVFNSKAGPVDCACKTLKSTDKEDLKSLLAEALLVSQFKHKNVVKCYGQVTKGSPPMIVFEFLANGALQDWLVKHGKESSLDVKLRMAIDIARGMAYLSKNSFIHRDLAARNILVSDQLSCKISDFGLSRDLEDDMYYQSEGGMVPIRWTAPEAFQYRKYSTKSDVWSYGILLYEILTDGKVPYGKQWTNLVVIVKVEGGFRLPPPAGCPRAIYKIMMDTWAPHRRARPTFESILTKLELAHDMMFAASDAKAEKMIEDDKDCSDLHNIYFGVPVPSLENIDEDPETDLYLAPTPTGTGTHVNAGFYSKAPKPPIRSSLSRALHGDDSSVVRNTAFEYSADGTAAEFKKKDLSKFAPNQGVASDASGPTPRRTMSLRKQVDSSHDEAEGNEAIGIEYTSNQQVAAVLALAKKRESLSAAETVGFAKLNKEKALAALEERPQYIERVGRAKDVAATKGARGRRGCKCRRAKCICNLDDSPTDAPANTSTSTSTSTSGSERSSSRGPNPTQTSSPKGEKKRGSVAENYVEFK